MVKFPEAEARMFRGVFVCKKCKKKVRAPNQKIIQKTVTCKGCGGHSFRPVRKK
ncbi:hypothetical protein ACFLZX_03720 [Nanoarchaeota archaeon]